MEARLTVLDCLWWCASKVSLLSMKVGSGTRKVMSLSTAVTMWCGVTCLPEGRCKLVLYMYLRSQCCLIQSLALFSPPFSSLLLPLPSLLPLTFPFPLSLPSYYYHLPLFPFSPSFPSLLFPSLPSLPSAPSDGCSEPSCMLLSHTLLLFLLHAQTCPHC